MTHLADKERLFELPKIGVISLWKHAVLDLSLSVRQENWKYFFCFLLIPCGDFLLLQSQLPVRLKCLVTAGLSGLAESGKKEGEKYGLPHC